MTVKNDRWSMFKDYMRNELRLSKDDIKMWLHEAVKAEARQTIHNSQQLDKVLKEVLVEQECGVIRFSEPMNQLIKEAVINMLKDHIVIVIK